MTGAQIRKINNLLSRLCALRAKPGDDRRLIADEILDQVHAPDLAAVVAQLEILVTLGAKA